jgi:heat shock protein HtpX
MAITFRDRIRANRRNSALLVAGFVLFFGVFAAVMGLAVVGYVDGRLLVQGGWALALAVGLGSAILAGAGSAVAFYAGDRMILGVSGAKEIEKRDDPELFNVVEEMAIAAGVPMPKVYRIADSAPNAFATGRDPAHAAVAITTGLREKLTRDELQGVMAHEMSHVRNLDIRLMLLLAVLVGTVVILADLFWHLLNASSRSRSSSSSSDKKDGGGVLVLVLIVLAVVLALLAPILAQIIQMAVSREREYLADATAVELTRNPRGLANALRKIDADQEVLEAANRGTAHLYIANPIKRFEARANSLMSSHPPIDERIRRLEAMGG